MRRADIPEFRTWVEMRRRCRNNPNYKNITVCDEWASDFDQFYADMGPKPSPGLTLDRINNKNGYSKENCKWATRTENNRHRRGVKMTMRIAEKIRKRYVPGVISQKELARRYCISQGTLSVLLAGKTWKSEYMIAGEEGVILVEDD